MKPGGVVVKHSGLWTRRREFESLPGYFAKSEFMLICLVLIFFAFSLCWFVKSDILGLRFFRLDFSQDYCCVLSCAEMLNGTETTFTI